jgi:hypothetical protein
MKRGRAHIGAHGITDGTKVFHSFRHSFIDALRLAGVPGEINIARVGHTDPSVNNKYGAKDKAIRFRHRLAEAIASVSYKELDLSHLTSPRATTGARRSTRAPASLTHAERHKRGRRSMSFVRACAI